MSSLIGNVPREKLKELIEKHGDTLLQDPGRCEGLLKDHCGAYRKEISALMGALDERIPLELKSSWQTAMTPEAMRARLVQRLEENRGLAPDVATWAVDAWSHALGVGLGRSSARVEEGVVDGGGAGKDGGPTIAERIASDKPGGNVAADSKPPLVTPKKAGIGAAAALLIAIGVFAAIHHPTPPPPGPDNNGGKDSGGQSGGGKDSGGNSGGNNGGNNNGGNGNGKPGAGTPAGGNGITKVGDNNGGNGGNSGGNSGGGNGGNKTIPSALTLPVGTAISVRLDRPLNSDELNVGDVVNATVSSPVTIDGNVVVATGAVAHLRVSSLMREGKQQELHLALVDVVSQQGRVATASEGRSFEGPALKNEQLKRGGIGGAVGAAGGFVVGKLFHHGGAGAAAGAGAGAVTGAVTAKAGPVKLPAETLMHFNLTAPAKAQR